MTSTRSDRPPIYVINLPEHRDRRQAMEERLRSVGMTGEFIPAVRGSNIPPEQLGHFYCEERCRREHGIILGPGAIGSSLSHIEANNRLLATPHPSAIILEDDVVLCEDLPAVLSGLSRMSPIDADIVLLGHRALGTRADDAPATFWRGPTVSRGRRLARPIGRALDPYGPFGSHAYVVSRKAAADICRQNMPVVQHADYFTSGGGGHSVVLVVPAVVTVDIGTASALQGERESVAKQLSNANAAVRTPNSPRRPLAAIRALVPLSVKMRLHRLRRRMGRLIRQCVWQQPKRHPRPLLEFRWNSK